ncbi:MAG: pilus assembly protein [Anaerolineaceae bacterium]|nr:pilus assembly protein [Anaerolineaceae bacterium]
MASANECKEHITAVEAEAKKMMKRHTINPQHKQRGQSLVEVALFFPIFVILLAGLVEVSQLLVTQNRVSSAARAGTRFASNGGEDDGITTVVLNNVTQTLELDQGVWDIWSIRAKLNAQGNDFTEWSFTKIYGISNTVRFPSVNETAIKDRVLEELQHDEFNNQSAAIAADLRIVGTYAIHDVDSILGLDAMSQLAGFSSLDALSVMRITGTSQNATNGCSAFPIAVEEGVRSVTDPALGGSNPYPNNFSYPSNPPVYNSFVNHRDDVPLLQAQEGDVFRIWNGAGSGNFGWLVWNLGVSANANTLANSLSWPGDSTNYSPCSGPGCPQGGTVPGSGFNHPVKGYIEPGDPTDQALHIGDWVAGSTGTVNSSDVRTILQGHVDLDRDLRVVVWRVPATGTGTNVRYQISGFAIVRLIGYNVPDNWILAEFKRWDDSCGQIN